MSAMVGVPEVGSADDVGPKLSYRMALRALTDDLTERSVSMLDAMALDGFR
ncbi:MAG: hypothetical protein ACLQPH_10240 [Acidimicrobiales bacterium]